VTSEQLPVTSDQLPVTSYQLPVTSDQLPVTSYQLPVTSDQLPVTSYQLPVDNEQLVINSKVYDKAYQEDTSFELGSNARDVRFAIRIVNAYKHLCEEKKEFVLSKQLLKSGTSIGANIAEANGGISKADFRAKMSIAYKECLETKYWLSLLKDTEYINEKAFNSIYKDAEEISKMLWHIVKNSN
jgi:four helix bundle protein